MKDIVTDEIMQLREDKAAISETAAAYLHEIEKLQSIVSSAGALWSLKHQW
jgi:hypothetical protein